MKHLNLTFIFSAWLATVVIFGLGAPSAVAQTEATCRSTYDLMLRNESTRPDIAATLGQTFLNQGCGKLFPTVVEPIKQLIAVAAPAAMTRPSDPSATAGQTGGGTVAMQEKQSIGKRYGSREPRTCDNTKAPANGAITAALAAKYFICAAEKVEGYYLYLVENVKVEVGASRPYNPNMDINVPEIDVCFPLYSIRGSHTQYQCKEENAKFEFNAPGRNCTRFEHQNAKGFCYKTTFGDWRCYQTDLNIPNENHFYQVPPPNGGKTAAAVRDEKPNRAVNETPNLPEGKFPQPDLSLLDQWYEISNVELNVYSRQLTFIAKAKRKEGRPTNFWVQFLDKNGVVIFEDTPLALRAWFGSDTPTEPKRILTGTPGEGSMSAVKTIKIVHKPEN